MAAPMDPGYHAGLMLEQLRQQSRSFIIWVLFGIIIAAFILFFGPQAGPDMFSCGQSPHAAVNIEGQKISANSWRFAMNGLGFGSGGGPSGFSNRHQAIDHLVERHLLASAAEERGFRVSDQQVNDQITNGIFYILGYRQDGTRTYFRDDVFDYDLLEQTARNLGLPSVAHFIEEQRRELLAEAMRELLLSSASVSEEEARAAYINQNTTVSLDYVKFDVARYAQGLKLGEADLESYAREHEEAVAAKWETEKARYTRDQEWLRARHLQIRKGDDEEAARGRAAAARDRVVAGEPFATVAGELSDDQRSKHRGGSLGWRAAGSLGFGPELVEAAGALEVGALSEVVETSSGFHVVQVDERHEGPLTMEKMRLDLAAELAPQHYGRERARAAAAAALAQAAETPLEEMFERKSSPPPQGLPDMGAGGDFSDLSFEEQEAIQRQIEEAIRSGAVDGMAPSDSVPPPADESDPGEEGFEGDEAGKGDEDAPIPGSEQGAIHQVWERTILAQAEGAPVERPRREEASPAAAAAAAEVELEVEPPALERVGPLPRSEFIAGIGRSKELARDLFETIEVGDLGARVYEVEDPEGFVIVHLTSRQDADLDEFEEQKEMILVSLRLEKGFDAYHRWLTRRCDEVTRSGHVGVTRVFLVPDDESDTAEEYGYQPCRFLSEEALQRKLIDRLAPFFGF